MDRLWVISTFDYTRGDNPSPRLSGHQPLHKQQCLWAGSRLDVEVLPIQMNVRELIASSRPAYLSTPI